MLRHKRCKHSAVQVAKFLSGNWRGAHLFNLESTLAQYDGLQELPESYDRKLRDEMKRQACEDLRQQECPSTPTRSRRRLSGAGQNKPRAARCTAIWDREPEP